MLVHSRLHGCGSDGLQFDLAVCVWVRLPCVCVCMRGRMCALACDNGRARGYRRSEADVQVRLSASARQALRCSSPREHTQVN